METVELWREGLWTWECPNCGVTNDVYDDSEPSVICRNCDKEFEPKFMD